jgi:hypothetical protein
MDDRNLYAPPASEVVDAQGPADRSDEFYIVSVRKFLLLFIGTFSLYQLYWFYMHWARYRRVHQLTLWPVPRAIFALFFAHTLANRIDESLRASKLHFAWAPTTAATVYVVAQLIGNLSDRIPWPGAAEPIATVVTLLMIIPTGWAMLTFQRAANTACGDADGESNRRLTAANYIWLVLGVLLWLLILFGVAASFLPEQYLEEP